MSVTRVFAEAYARAALEQRVHTFNSSNTEYVNMRADVVRALLDTDRRVGPVNRREGSLIDRRERPSIGGRRLSQGCRKMQFFGAGRRSTDR